jgi:hypothetical protein
MIFGRENVEVIKQAPKTMPEQFFRNLKLKFGNKGRATESWKEALLTVFFKGDTKRCENRGEISLLNVKIITNKLQNNFC